MGKVKEMEFEGKAFAKGEEYLDELLKYQEAYDILMDYWDLFPEEALQEIHKRLEKIGL